MNEICSPAGDSAQQPWRQPRCRSPHKRSLMSSSTIYATNRRRSKHAALFPNTGFIGHENTSSLASNSTPRNPTPNRGRRRPRILPTLPLTTHAPSPFMAFLSSPPRMRMRVVGSAHFNVVDLQLECFGWEDHKVSLVPFHGLSLALRSLRLIYVSREIWISSVPFPFSTIWSWFPSTADVMHGTLPRPHPNSPGISS